MRLTRSSGFAAARDCPNARVPERAIVPRLAAALIRDGQGARGLVGHDTDRGGLRRQGERGVGQRLEAAPIGRVRGVGDQLAQEDLAIRVERVHD